jgi:predicted porin
MRKLFALLAAIAMVAAFTLPVMAQETEWSFYGSVRMTTFWDKWDRAAMNNYFGTAHIDDDSDLTWANQSNSRLGARVSAGDISGRIELGLNDEGARGVRARLVWGQWDFGVGSIRIGRDYSPSELWNGSNQVWWIDNALTGMGYFYAGRNDQIKFIFPVGGGELQFAFVEPSTNGAPVAAATGLATESDTTIPKLEAMFTRNFGPVYWILTGGYNTYKENIIATEVDHSIDSWVIGTCLGYTAGPFYAYGSIYAGQNLVEYGQSFGYDWEQGAVFNAATNSIEDDDTWGGSIVAGYSPMDILTLEGGWGLIESKVDLAPGVESKDKSQMYYLQARIQVAKGFRIIPEIGKYDLKDREAAGVTTDQGDNVYFGAQWRIDF